MKNFHLLAGVLGVFGLTLLEGCATESMSRSAQAAPPATYAVIAVDSQGVLPAAEYQKVEVGIIQYLLDEGYVRAEDKYVTDVLNADVVFRVRIAWTGTKGGFTVAEVKPTFSPRPYAQSAGGGGAATTYVPWYAAGGWYDNPWWYGEDYGPDYWPYAGLAGLSALAPFYIGGHREPGHGDRDHRARDHDQPGGPTRHDWGHDGRADRHEFEGDRTHRSWAGPPVDRWHDDNRRVGSWRPQHQPEPARGRFRPHHSAPSFAPSRSFRRPAQIYSPPPRSFAAPARSYSPPRAARPAERNAEHGRHARA